MVIAKVMANWIPLTMLLLTKPLSWFRVGRHDVVRRAMALTARMNKHFRSVLYMLHLNSE